MAGVRFYVTTDYAQAKDLVDRTLSDHGFSLEYSDAYNCTAERGSKTATMLVGAFAGKKNQHLVLAISYYVWQQGGQLVDIRTANTGAAAGAIGVARLQDAFSEVTATLRGAFAQSAILSGEVPY